jgi:hypothetical protein
MERKPDEYELCDMAEAAGRAAWKPFLAARFPWPGPKNPFKKSDFQHEFWWIGYTDAMAEWFKR